MHDGVTEDGRLATCGICGCEVHMLDPEEQDWICDPCSTDGWSGIRMAYRLRPGDVIRIARKTLCVLSVEEFGRKLVWLTCRNEEGQEVSYVRRSTRQTYIHMNRQPV